MIPALDGVQEKLARGALVADVGSGDGALVLAVAKAFPNSTFHAIDPSKHSVAHIERRAAEYGLDNVHAFVAPAEKFPTDERYDLIVTFDCIHDDPAAEGHRRNLPETAGRRHLVYQGYPFEAEIRGQSS